MQLKEVHNQKKATKGKGVFYSDESCIKTQNEKLCCLLYYTIHPVFQNKFKICLGGGSTSLVYHLVRKSSLSCKANPVKYLCFLSDLQGVSLAKTARQRKQVQSHAMNSSTPHVFNTPATSNTRHRPNLIEYDGAGMIL